MKEAFESINSELFNSFNPNDELWIGGVGHTMTGSVYVTNSVSGQDALMEGDIDFAHTEEPKHSPRP